VNPKEISLNVTCKNSQYIKVPDRICTHIDTKSGLGHISAVTVRKGGPRGTRQKKLQNWDSMQLEGGFGGIQNDIGSLGGFYS
jgi:hypothetical protein